MANPFDQFDASPQEGGSGHAANPFDQFDAASPASKEGSGIVSNVGAGINRGIAQTLGLAGDMGTLLAGPQMPSEIEGPISRFSRRAGNWIAEKAGPAAIERAMGVVGANPENVKAVTGGERLARNVGENVGAMVAPGIGAEAALARGTEGMSVAGRAILEGLRGSPAQPSTAAATAANAGRNALIGAGAGAGQTAAQEVAPDSPTASFLGSMAGGLGVGAGEAAFRYAASRPSLETRAADRLLASATDPAAVQSRLTGGEPLAPLEGSRPTTPEATGDLGLLQVQNWARNQRPEAFAARAAENNAARAGALAGLAPDGEAATPGQMLTDRLNHLETAHQAMVDAAETRARETMETVGPGAEPELIGAQARTAIGANYAPGMAMTEQADETARQRLLGAAQRVGGNQTAGDADTVRQQYGDQLRQFVQEGRDARAQAESRLWDAARQNGDLVFDHTPATAAAEQARGMINPAGGDRLTPAEASLYDTIGQWSGPQDFDTIKAMRSNIGDAADMAFRSGDRRAGSRLLTVRKGLDQSIESAIDSRVAQERAAVQAGALDPTRTFEAALLRGRDQWQSARATGERPGAGVASAGSSAATAQPIGEGAISRGSGAASAAPEGRADVAGDPGLAGAPAQGSTVDRYAAARAFTRETHQIFDQTPAGSVIARGPYGAPEKLPSSLVPGKFAGATTRQVENARNFEAAVGGRPEAIAALQDYLAFDLKNAAWNADAGRLNPMAFQKWVKAHDGLLTIYPELRAALGNLAQAQEGLAQAETLRAALTKKLADALGDSNATVMSQYFRRGPAGADGIDRFLKETGATPQALQAMADHVTNDFLARATADGRVVPGRFIAWQAANQPALSRLPKLAARFADAATAQTSVTEALAAKTQAVREFETGAAKFWLRTDPTTAVANALSKRSGNNPAQNMRDLMAMTKGDAAAQAGVKRAVLGWLTDKGVSGKAAALTGTDFIKTQAMQDLVNDNRAALREVFTPKEMRTLDQVAADLKMSDRSITGSKAPIGPGTARDIAARDRYGGEKPSLLRVLGGALSRTGGSYLAGHLMFGPVGGLATVVGAGAAHQLTTAMRSANEATIQSLIIGAILDPEQARTLLMKATPANVEPLVRQLARRMGQAAVAGATAH